MSLINKDGLATKVFGPDLDHIHHKLMRRGMTQRKAAIALYGAAIFVVLVALGASAMADNRVALLLVGMIVVLHVVVRQGAQVELWTTTQVVLQGVRRPRSIVSMLVSISSFSATKSRTDVLELIISPSIFSASLRRASSSAAR